MREQLQPLTDELIQRCMSIGPWEYNGKPLWHRILDFAMHAGKPAVSRLYSGMQRCRAVIGLLLSCTPSIGSLLCSSSCLQACVVGWHSMHQT